MDKGGLIMRYIFKNLITVLILLVIGTTSARAEVFVWKDPHSGVSLSFPDRWALTHNQKPDDIITITAPIITDANDHAACRIRAREDHRFSIYPARFHDEIQRVYFGPTFWNSYIAEYDRGRIDHVHDNAGLGLAHASYAEITFRDLSGVSKHGIALAGLYNNKLYIFECAAKFDAFHKWKDAFGGILKSVDFEKIIQQNPTGQYRNFLGDRKTRIQGKRYFDSYTF